MKIAYVIIGGLFATCLFLLTRGEEGGKITQNMLLLSYYPHCTRVIYECTSESKYSKHPKGKKSFRRPKLQKSPSFFRIPLALISHFWDKSFVVGSFICQFICSSFHTIDPKLIFSPIKVVKSGTYINLKFQSELAEGRDIFFSPLQPLFDLPISDRHLRIAQVDEIHS